MNIVMQMKAVIVAGGALALFASSAPAQDTSFGERLYHEKADCAFCHGPQGDGRGDPRSPGKAANLRTTPLKREHLIEVVTCGRPRTEMPHFDKYAYEDTACYGLTLAQVGTDKPPPPHAGSLNQREIAAVVDYILATFVGK
jgi:mono/diheme cytochrome c family protein